MKISIRMLQIEKKELNFLFNTDHQPIIEIENKHYSSLDDLCKALPILLTAEYLDQYVQLANFFACGLEFEFIEDIPKFIKNYKETIENELLAPFDQQTKLSEYGEFDLSSIHSPKLLDGRCVFFVKHDYLNIPYRASFIYPHQESSPKIKYELLSSQQIYDFKK